MPNAKETGKKLRLLRGEKSREEVANACNISVSALTMYETGGRTPRDEIKVSLAKYYGLTVGDLFFAQ